MTTESKWSTVGTSLVARKLASAHGLEIALDDSLADWLHSCKRMLIVLDCCQRVAEAAAVLVENCLRRWVCLRRWGCRHLSTSRELLPAVGESVYRLPHSKSLLHLAS
jgi:predicted ATPase